MGRETRYQKQRTRIAVAQAVNKNQALASQRLCKCISAIIAVTERTPGRREGVCIEITEGEVMVWFIVFIKFQVQLFVPADNNTQGVSGSCWAGGRILLEAPGWFLSKTPHAG